MRLVAGVSFCRLFGSGGFGRGLGWGTSSHGVGVPLPLLAWGASPGEVSLPLPLCCATCRGRLVLPPVRVWGLWSWTGLGYVVARRRGTTSVARVGGFAPGGLATPPSLLCDLSRASRSAACSGLGALVVDWVGVRRRTASGYHFRCLRGGLRPGGSRYPSLFVVRLVAGVSFCRLFGSGGFGRGLGWGTSSHGVGVPLPLLAWGGFAPGGLATPPSFGATCRGRLEFRRYGLGWPLSCGGL